MIITKSYTSTSDTLIFLTILFIAVYLQNIGIFYFSLIVLIYILIIYFIKKYYLFMVLIPIICDQMKQNIFITSNKTVYQTYVIINKILPRLPNKKQKSFLYLIESNGKRVLLRSFASKDYFIQYKSALSQPNYKYDFFLEKYVMEEEKIYSLRSMLYKKLKGLDVPYILPILLGIKEGDFTLFKKTGTWHLLCVGGLHMHFLKNTLTLVSNLFLCGNPARIYPLFYLIELLILWLFTYLSGGHIPALRSVIMLSFDLFARCLHFYIPTELRFYLTFLLLLSYDISYIFDIGFQMSFLAVYMIISFGYHIRSHIKYIKGIKLYIMNSLYINFLIAIATIMHSFLLHGNINIISPCLNFVTIPIFLFNLLLIPFNVLGILQGLSRSVFIVLKTILFYGDKYGIFFTLKIKKAWFYYYLIPYIVCIVLLKYLYLYLAESQLTHKL